MKHIFLLLLVSFTVFDISAQNVEWSTQHKNNAVYNGKKGVGVDSNGNTYMLGASTGSPKIPYISKFSEVGQAMWTDTAISNLGFMRLKADEKGNSFLLGNFIDSIQLGSIILTDTVPYGTSFYAKIDSTGAFQWAHILPHRVVAFDVYPLSSGEFYISGSTSMVGAYIGSNYFNANNGFIAKYDSSGNCLEATLISNSHAFFFIEHDKAGNFYIAGDFNGTIAIGQGTDIIYANSGSGTSVLIAKFDSNMTVQWVKVGKTYGVYEPTRGLGVDSSGNVYVGGTLGFYMNFEGHIVSTSGNNMFLVKYDSLGNYQWMKYSYNLNSGTAVNKCFSSTVDAAGNSYVTGNIWSDTTAFDSYVINGEHQPYLIKYDTDGNLVWGLNSEILPSGIVGEGVALCADNIGNVYIAGNYGEYAEKSFITKISESGIVTEIQQTESNAELMIYPNPTGGNFFVNYSSAEITTLELTVLNALGQKVYSEKIPRFQGEFKKEISTSNFSKGIYTVQIRSGKNLKFKKVVVI